MEKELQKLKRENNRLKQNLESTQLNSPRNPPRFEESVVQRTPAFGQSESQKVIITTNNAELDKARKQLEKLDEENRSLLKMNYEVNF